MKIGIRTPAIVLATAALVVSAVAGSERTPATFVDLKPHVIEAQQLQLVDLKPHVISRDVQVVDLKPHVIENEQIDVVDLNPHLFRA